MRKTLIILVMISVLFHHLFAQKDVEIDTSSIVKKQKSDFSFNYLMRSDNVPAYEKAPFLRDYRVNQTIKGMIRWGTIGAAAGVGLYLFNPDEMTIGLTIYPLMLGSIGVISGAIFGYRKGVSYNKFKRDESDFLLKKNIVGYESKIFDLPNFANSKYSQNLYLTFRKPVFFFDELRVGYIHCEWEGKWDEDAGYSYSALEDKIDINGLIYLTDNLFTPYYGIGFGYSKGCNRFFYLHDPYDELGGPIKTYIKTAFIHAFVGLNWNIYDFLFIRFNLDYEISGFYYEIAKLHDYPLSGNSMFNIMFGTYIF